eukprot:TRINITY_DN3473_c0_g1_i5.p1 TRINITY_DN3473_c0_g1~~TRINITY_DN3473_c0_g1_i5.p1  ORF type:complete len:629 (-),score=117.29 TRINITY_DN3473_c0_g1_i5:599-2485(-)
MSQFRFTPLYGARDEGPICSLLEVDDVRILLDCGWNETLDESLLEPLRDVCKQVQLVLITHGDFNHAGALPYAVSKFNLNCTIYATKAAKFLAEQTIKAFIKTKSSEQFFSLFTLEDIDRTFRLFDELAYSEYRNIKRHNSFIKIRSQAAGHSVGGAFWEISNEIDKIIYAVDYNHQRDRHLNRTVLETFTQPTLLITDAINALEPKIRRREIDEQILHSIQETLVAGGNVLIPVDTAGRTFEVLILLDFFVHTRQLQAPVIFLDETSSDVVRKTAKTFRDLMIKAKGDSNVEDCPLEVKHIRFFHKLDDLKPIVQPKVVVTYSSSLELGLSRVLFARWASDPRNKVIFTHRPDPGTLAQTILTNTKINDIIQIELRTLIPLDGVELESYLQNRRIQKEKEEQERRAREDGRLENINNFDDNSDNDEDELVHKKGKKISPSWAQYRLKKMFLSATRKYEAENLMYTFEEARFVSDDYGEEINMELFQEKLPQPIQVQEQPNQTKDEIEEEENEKEDEVPKKEFREVHEIRVCCAFEYINLEGRSDGESVKSILSNMKPKSVVCSLVIRQHFTLGRLFLSLHPLQTESFHSLIDARGAFNTLFARPESNYQLSWFHVSIDSIPRPGASC